MTQHAEEIQSGERFEFGSNWTNFLAVLDDNRIKSAEASLTSMLKVINLEGKSFLDIGCGSGLFSLAARRLGAKVHSLDFDPESVACAQELKRRYFPQDKDWTIEEASALDSSYLSKLKEFDVVYSWGVLHHTGEMWRALHLASKLVKPGGLLFIAIYNDQGNASEMWLEIKRLYNHIPKFLRPVLVFLVASFFELRHGLKRLITLQNPFPSYDIERRRAARGMSLLWHDWVDWVGGLPYEVATTEAVVSFLQERDFTKVKLVPDGGWGCNQFVMQRNQP